MQKYKREGYNKKFFKNIQSKLKADDREHDSKPFNISIVRTVEQLQCILGLSMNQSINQQIHYRQIG